MRVAANTEVEGIPSCLATAELWQGRTGDGGPTRAGLVLRRAWPRRKSEPRVKTPALWFMPLWHKTLGMRG